MIQQIDGYWNLTYLIIKFRQDDLQSDKRKTLVLFCTRWWCVENCVYKKWQLQMTLNLISSISLSGADLMGIGGLFTYWKTATTPTKEMAT